MNLCLKEQGIDEIIKKNRQLIDTGSRHLSNVSRTFNLSEKAREASNGNH